MFYNRNNFKGGVDACQSRYESFELFVEKYVKTIDNEWRKLFVTCASNYLNKYGDSIKQLFSENVNKQFILIDGMNMVYRRIHYFNMIQMYHDQLIKRTKEFLFELNNIHSENPRELMYLLYQSYDNWDRNLPTRYINDIVDIFKLDLARLPKNIRITHLEETEYKTLISDLDQYNQDLLDYLKNIDKEFGSIYVDRRDINDMRRLLRRSEREKDSYLSGYYGFTNQYINFVAFDRLKQYISDGLNYQINVINNNNKLLLKTLDDRTAIDVSRKDFMIEQFARLISSVYENYIIICTNNGKGENKFEKDNVNDNLYFCNVSCTSNDTCHYGTCLYKEQCKNESDDLVLMYIFYRYYSNNKTTPYFDQYTTNKLLKLNAQSSILDLYHQIDVTNQSIQNYTQQYNALNEEYIELINNLKDHYTTLKYSLFINYPLFRKRIFDMLNDLRETDNYENVIDNMTNSEEYRNFNEEIKLFNKTLHSVGYYMQEIKRRIRKNRLSDQWKEIYTKKRRDFLLTLAMMPNIRSHFKNENLIEDIRTEFKNAIEQSIVRFNTTEELLRLIDINPFDTLNYFINKYVDLKYKLTNTNEKIKTETSKNNRNNIQMNDIDQRIKTYDFNMKKIQIITYDNYTWTVSNKEEQLTSRRLNNEHFHQYLYLQDYLKN